MTRYDQVLDLADGTRTAREIAELLGVSVPRIHSVATAARRRGEDIVLVPGYLRAAEERACTGMSWRDVLPYADGTRTAAEVAKILNVPKSRVSNAVAYAVRQHGHHAKLRSERAIKRKKRARVSAPTGGGIHQMLARLPPDVRAWFFAQVPAGGTVIDMLGAIIADAHAEENDNAVVSVGDC